MTTTDTPAISVTIAPVLVGTEVAAVMLGMSQRTFQRMASAGEVPAPMKVGGKALWSVDELKSWASAGCPTATIWEARSAGRTVDPPGRPSHNHDGRLSMNPAGLRYQ